MITKNLFVLSTIAVFAVAFIAIRKNIQQKTRIAIHKNLKKIIKLPKVKTSSTSNIKKLRIDKKLKKNIKAFKKKIASKDKKQSEKTKITFKTINKPVQSITAIPAKIIKVEIKIDKVDSKKIKLPSAVELSHLDVVSLSGFKVELPNRINLLALYDDYSKKSNARIVADKVKTIQSKTVKKKEIKLSSLIEIPRLEDLNLGYESISRTQYIEEYKSQQQDKLKVQKESRKLKAVASIRLRPEGDTKKGIRRIKRAKKEVERRSKEEARKDKEEKLASVVGKSEEQEKTSSAIKLNTQKSKEQSVNTQEEVSNHKDLDSQKTWFNLGDYQQSKEVKTAGRAPAIVKDSEQVRKIEDKVELTESSVANIEVKNIEPEEIIEESTESDFTEQEQELADAFNSEVDGEIHRKHEELDSIITQMNEKLLNKNEPTVTKARNTKRKNVVTNSSNISNTLNFNNIENNKSQHRAASPVATFNSSALGSAVKKVEDSTETSGDSTETSGDSLIQEEVVTLTPSAPAISQASTKSNVANDKAIQDAIRSAQMNPGASDTKQSLKTLQSAVAKIEQKSVKVVHKLNSPIRSSLKINVDSVRVNKMLSKKQSNFDIRFFDSFFDVYSDHGTGSVIIKTKLNNRMAVRGANIVLHGHLPTNTDLVFEPENFEIDIPLIETATLEEMLDSNKLVGKGGYVLIQLDSERITDDVRIDKDFEKKLFLDENFNVVDPGSSDYLYMIFIGVEPGNALISYATKNSEVATKIVFITENEVYFDTNEYIRKNKDEFDLVENHLLGNKNLELILTRSEINILASSKSPNKKGLNNYVYKNVLYPLGTRQYSVLKHLNDVLFIGRWNNSLIEVPSEEYIKFIMDKFKMDNIGSQCVIQVNLSKKPKKVISSGRTIQGHMRLDKKILDSDGQIFEEVSENTNKIFIVGEQQGVINAKISYLDGSFDYLQTYCSEDTYLVEQM